MIPTDPVKRAIAIQRMSDAQKKRSARMTPEERLALGRVAAAGVKRSRDRKTPEQLAELSAARSARNVEMHRSMATEKKVARVEKMAVSRKAATFLAKTAGMNETQRRVALKFPALMSRFKSDGTYAAGLKRFTVVPLSVADVIDRMLDQCMLCPYTGIALRDSHPLYGPISIDRIDSTRTYEAGNISVTYHRVNTAKGSLSEKEFISLCRQVAAFNP